MTLIVVTDGRFLSLHEFPNRFRILPTTTGPASLREGTVVLSALLLDHSYRGRQVRLSKESW